MGRKKSVPVQTVTETPAEEIPETSAEETPSESPPTEGLRPPNRGEKSELIRKILDDYPNLSNAERAAKFNAEARQQGIDMYSREKGEDFAQEISNRRKKEREAAESNGEQPIVRKPSAQKSEPTMSDLRAVKRIADEKGGIKKLTEALNDLIDLADEVGGLDRLRQCLEFWQGMED